MRLLILAAMLVLPGAQALSLEMEPPAEFLAPGETLRIPAAIVVDCSELVGPTARLAGGAEPELTMTYETDPRLDIVGPASVTFARTACVGSQESVTQWIDIDVTPKEVLPALEVIHLSTSVTWPENAAEFGIVTGLQMDFLPDFTATLATPAKSAQPQKQIDYVIELSNLANGKSRFTFELVTDGLQGQVILPAELILDAADQEHARAEAVVIYATPFENGPNSVAENFTIRIHQQFAFDAERKGPSYELDISAETKGVYVPGPGALLIPAIVGAALLRRRA